MSEPETASAVKLANEGQGQERVYEAIAHSLREFGYADVTARMIRECDEGIDHGVVSMFAKRQLDEARERGLL